MALIGEIRQRSWLLIVLIGLAMAGFIFMDMFSGKQSILAGRQMQIGEVAGEEINQPEFERAYSALYNNSAGDVHQNRQQLWEFMVEDRLVRQEARETGLDVPQEEMEDLQWGTTLSPIIEARFRDPQTGQVNRTNLNSYRDAERDGTINDRAIVAAPQRNFWMYQKREVQKQRLQDKLAALVSKSLYTPDWMAEEVAKGQNTRVDLAYVKIPYEAVPEAQITLTDADYEAFMAKEGYRFKRDEPARSVAYVAFDVYPTIADSNQYRSELLKTIEKWRNAPADSVFVAQQRGEYPVEYLSDEELPEAVRGAEVGTIVGPYLDGSSYVISKIVNRKVIPDSVRSRHILLPGKTQEELQRSIALADSLENLIESGTNTFEELAQQFSTGPTSVKGGDLGFVAPGAMVPAFNNLIFYTAEEGKLYRTLTQFGLHIVEVTGKQFINENEGTRVANIRKEITPSSETQKELYEVASRFAQTNRTVEELKAAAEADPNLEFVDGNLLAKNDFILGALGSGTASRDIAKFAFNNDVGTVSANVYPYKSENGFFDGSYVVAAVTGEMDAGVPDALSAKSMIESDVMRMKKAAMVGSSGGDLPSIAARFGVEPDTARAVNFGATFIPGIGSEPEVMAKAFTLGEQQVSEPIAAKSAIYVIKPLVRTNPGDVSANIANVRRTQSSQSAATIRSGFGAALRRGADVEDTRERFY